MLVHGHNDWSINRFPSCLLRSRDSYHSVGDLHQAERPSSIMVAVTAPYLNVPGVIFAYNLRMSSHIPQTILRLIIMPNVMQMSCK